jgi:SAM-dependent methyltransferase
MGASVDNSAIDSFTATAGLVGDRESPDTQAEAEFAIAVLHLQPGSRVLDLPCGNGRHAWVFGQRGIRVTAADVDTRSLELARRDCAHPNVEYLQLDARAAGELGTFDAVASLFSCIGYLEDEAGDEAALRAMAKVLRPGGRFLLSTANGPVIARAGSTRTVFEHGPLHIERIDTCELQGRTLERRFLVQDQRTGERTEIHHRRRLYSLDELSSFLASCGITEIGRASDYRGAPFVADRSPHGIYLGRRDG